MPSILLSAPPLSIAHCYAACEERWTTKCVKLDGSQLGRLTKLPDSVPDKKRWPVISHDRPRSSRMRLLEEPAQSESFEDCRIGGTRARNQMTTRGEGEVRDEFDQDDLQAERQRSSRGNETDDVDERPKLTLTTFNDYKM